MRLRTTNIKDNQRMKEHVIKEVKPGSIAEELEIEAGDVLLSIEPVSK